MSKPTPSPASPPSRPAPPPARPAGPSTPTPPPGPKTDMEVTPMSEHIRAAVEQAAMTLILIAFAVLCLGVAQLGEPEPAAEKTVWHVRPATPAESIQHAIEMDREARR